MLNYENIEFYFKSKDINVIAISSYLHKLRSKFRKEMCDLNSNF